MKEEFLYSDLFFCSFWDGSGMHRLSKINPQMMQQVFSIQGLSQHKKTLSTHKDLVGSLPRQTSIDSSRPVAEPYCLPSQLTIFYKGTVNVYDISAQKACFINGI